ncbi:ABC superfamily ATP binding cassette transporter, ABC protein [Actinomyces sp. oral taxon 178 str. F0338]|nr:ABC superfamily ATP binding cassette transporter, ABC protein [Actinomyces sp. oral taxon 178 str. F0338]
MAAPVQPRGGALLEIDGLTLRRRSAVVLDRVSLSLDPGHIVALMGANGSGKTTLMKTVAGVLADYEGRVAIGGSAPGARTKGIVSYLPDAPFLDPATTPERAVGMYSHFFADFDRAKAGELVERFGLVEHQPVREMSKGMREKLHIALVMSRRARLFLLDEPLSGVDPVARRVVLEEIVRDFAPDALMLIATHLIGDVEAVADRAAFMDAGRIVFEGDADDLRAERGAFLEEIFRGELR